MKSKELLAFASILIPLNANIGTPTRKTNIKKKDKSKILPNGLKEFNIDGYKIYAINLKNALRKTKKIKQTKDK
ncbi:hypothetical protein [Riemerella anatipestifer]|uniref:hypothetical protein n=1 Tax=Riemerella anatipestifer TaxID=34085 RepID=UPI00129EDE8D|nr:hypothetical protein [Riemerella anatipestifer]MRM83387.1 hypothetical protein [Riemerella anatipestifer]